MDGNVAKIDLAARGVDGALVHFNAPSWAVRAVMSSTTLPVCPKTGSTSPSLTVHLCLHTAPGNRECARSDWPASPRSEPPALDRRPDGLPSCYRLASGVCRLHGGSTPRFPVSRSKALRRVGARDRDGSKRSDGLEPTE